ncbi:hypothetical protein F2P79_023326 [Pimephales promelas]|nr:hypothetical protein F2P79_023326 [Pimephales promelas]KAG1928868.1 hypothetical protein F2P79_023326 [Pimephales promelas]KAG1928870.1 hypothetical protein F2P79_023326 [Pimephales promelas]
MHPSRKCILPAYYHIPNRPVSLFKFPKNEQMKKKWINFVKRHLTIELRFTANTRLCSDHFTQDCFINFHQRQLGFTHNPLLLANGAEPTISRLILPPSPPPPPPPPPPPVQPTPTAIISRVSPPVTPCQLPTTRETQCQRNDTQKVTREVGCQTDPCVGERTVANKTGSQATVVTRSATMTNTTSLLPLLCSSSTLKRRAGSPDRPSKRPLLEFPSFQESVMGFNTADPDDSSMSELVDTTSEQGQLFQDFSRPTLHCVNRLINLVLPTESSFQDTHYQDVEEALTSLVISSKGARTVEAFSNSPHWFAVLVAGRAPTKPPQDMVKYLVYEECLLELFKTCPTCSSVCKVIKFVKGTFLSVTQKCQSCSYSREWRSQPLLGSSPAGNLHLSAAVYYTGGSFMQTNQVLNALRVRTFSRTTHRNHVRNFILPSVLRKWRSHQSDLLERLKQRGTVSLGGDMRADGPGQCAKYGSYSMMDLRTNKIVDIQLVQSSEVGSRVRMEKEGLIRSLGFLEKSGVKVSSLVTDRHTRVQKFLQEQKPDVDHFYDAWRLCKALNKKIDAVSKEKHCNKVKMWKKSINNHLYWSASGSSDGEQTVAKWTSLLNHVQNVHVHEHPLFPKCLHPPSTGKNKWLKPGTKAIYKLEKVLMNKRVLGDVKKLSPVHQSSALEAFHSEILRFAPKNVAFSYLGMLCRLYLAALHFNENSGRTQARTAAGELQFNIKVPKAKRGEHVSMMKTKYSTEYVTELTNILFNEVMQDPAPFVADLKAVAVPGSLCSQYERPGKSDAIASHVSSYRRERGLSELERVVRVRARVPDPVLQDPHNGKLPIGQIQIDRQIGSFNRIHLTNASQQLPNFFDMLKNYREVERCSARLVSSSHTIRAATCEHNRFTRDFPRVKKIICELVKQQKIAPCTPALRRSASMFNAFSSQSAI